MPNEKIKSKWNKIYSSQDLEDSQPKPAEVLSEHACLLPSKGLALDLAAGLGGNAIFLAQSGLQSHAWDISQQAMTHLQHYCDENDIQVITETRDIEQDPPTANSFDVISVSYYLERSLSQFINDALKPMGLLFYQTFIKEKVSDEGPSNPNYRLHENELLKLFPSLHILAYKEYGCIGNQKIGLRNVAQLVAQKR